LERLLIERVRQRRTLRDLAAQTGLNPHTINDIERGLREPRKRTLILLADALGIDPDELMSGKVTARQSRASA
jgi:transcriptional regulator with XRE-family HTH domain